MEHGTVFFARTCICYTLLIGATDVDIESSFSFMYLALFLMFTRLFVLKLSHPVHFSLPLEIFIVTHIFTQWALLLMTPSVHDF